MTTYDNYIDEFVDWVTGEDTSEKVEQEKQRVSSTGGLPVSGGSIRELLQTRLKKPFVTLEDSDAGLYRMFSSESTKTKWQRLNDPENPEYDPDNSKHLELFNFVRPADTIITIGTITSNPKYVIYGDETSNNASLRYTVSMLTTEGSPAADAFSVTYTVVDSNGVEHIEAEERDSTYANGSTLITKTIYSMLTIGKNDVTIAIKAKNTSARTSLSFSVYLIEFELSSTFKYFSHWDPDKEITVPISVKRSDNSLILRVDVYIDGKQANLRSGAAATWTVGAGGNTNPTTELTLQNTYAGNVKDEDKIIHQLKIEALMYDKDQSVVYFSNVLFYDFIIASKTPEIVNRFVTMGYSTPYAKMSTDVEDGRVIFQMTQYEPFTLPWAYYTDRINTEQTINVEWNIRTGDEADGYTYSPITIAQGINNAASEPLRFIPDFYTEDDTTRLVALYNGKELMSYRIQSEKSQLSISETGGYALKLQAYGKTNASSDRASWTDTANNINTTFVNIAYDSNSGWNNNSFVTSGIGSYAQINYVPIASNYDLAGEGKTIEVDFKAERVVNEDDTLILIGDPNRGHIRITTNKASLYNGTTSVVHTNYKSNERIKLAFVFNRVESNSKDSNLVFIINNGILERAASYGQAANFTSSSGIFKIGDCESGVRVYNVRVYNKPLSTEEELNNYIYDCDNKAEVVNRNDIFEASVIDYNKVKNKIDTILLTGDLSKILAQGTGKDDSESTINFKRECVTDASRSFEVTNGMIRKHGQSTLNYPITSMKIWTNKASNSDIIPSITLSDSLKAQDLAKNRYIMKSGAIPANKFVLQANYADSSGVHNGGLLRLIHDTWYNAKINNQYILRTAPLLFASGNTLTHNDANLHEDGSWVEGYGVGQAAGKTWKDIASRDFPYEIRNAPDSFPCAVFYKNGPNDGYHFLGQYVFMDDKKSDYIYGERSIYYFGNGTDPFVLRTENTKNGANGKQDTNTNLVWDNKNVLRIEVVLPNTKLTSYMDFDVAGMDGKSHSCTDIKVDEAGNNVQYYWEDDFEMIYPDTDDIEEDDAAAGMDKFNPNSKFVKKAKPFIDFLKWITDCNRNYNKATDWWSAGQYTTRQLAFENTAAQHLDLYKVAAYYIFFLRFGLVDSVERNAQLKTYDGQHWHYEPWDMDIALGNTNQGALILNPPLNRDSMEPGTTTYAYSGKSNSTSNVLWDCLENWDYWSNTVVPKVALSLYEAGLTYDNIIKMFDNEYADKWSETMYNESGHFKYIENGGSDKLAWLQGSRTSHRHWWVSTSMNYYDAKWSCGSFIDHRLVLFVDKNINPVGTDIVTIKPTSDTFFKMTQLDGNTSLGTKEASPNNPAKFDISTVAFSTKDPAYVLGGTFIEEIDLNCFAEKIKTADFSLCYDETLGASVKKISIALPYTTNSSTVYTGKTSGTQMRITFTDKTGTKNAFDVLQELDITGQGNITDINNLLLGYDLKSITNLYAIGTNITQFSSSNTGNKFNSLKLPAVTTITYKDKPSTQTKMSSFTMTNSSWENLEFWNTDKSGDIEYEYEEDGTIRKDDEGIDVIKPNVATFTKTNIPSTINVVNFKGSTASNECSAKFILEWINSIEQDLKKTNPSATEEDLYKVLNSKSFEAENINWGGPSHDTKFSYKDIARIGHFNDGNNSGGKIKGYVMLSDKTELTTEQLNDLTTWFGPSVFNKGALNSNLVIDQELTYTRITFGNAKTVNGVITLEEGSSTTVNATKFVLSETDSSNYEWRLGANNPNGGRVEGSNVLSCELRTNSEGQVILVANESGLYDDGNGGYDLTVTVYIDGQMQSQVIRIVAAKLPKSMSIVTSNVSGDNARRLYVDDVIKSRVSTLRITPSDSYILTTANQKVEFYPTFSETPGQNGYSKVKQIKFSINNSANIDQSELTGEEDSLLNRTQVPGTNGYLYYTKSATKGGIVLGITSAPTEMMVVTLLVSAIIGEKTYIQTVGIVLYDDSVAIYDNTKSFGILQTIKERFEAIYGINTLQGNRLYKSDLLSLHGDLDFSSYANQVVDMTTLQGDRLIKYLPNIDGLIFNNCQNIDPTSNAFGTKTQDTLVFESMPNLTTINFNSCNRIGGLVNIDFSNCQNLKTISLKDSFLGVILNDSRVSTLELGSPKKVHISNPKILKYSGVTIENSINLEDISLINVNVGEGNVLTEMNGFNVFDILYS